MIRCSSKNRAFTLAEVMIIFAIIAVVASCTLIITKSKLDYTKRYWAYGAYNNIKLGVSQLVAQGCNSTDNAVCPNVKALPVSAYVNPIPSGDLNKNGGFCQRFVEQFNTIGSTDCNPATTTVPDGTTDFSTVKPNFTASNSVKFYNIVSTGNATCTQGNVAGGYCFSTPSNQGPYNPGVNYCSNTLSNGFHSLNALSSNMTLIASLLAQAFPTYNGDIWSGVDTIGGMLYYTCSGGSCAWDWSNIADPNTDLTKDIVCVQPISSGYTVYIDIDGAKGKNILNDDVFKFVVGFDGSVYPAADSLIANDKDLLSVSVKQGNNWLLKGISFREATCVGNLQKSADYCAALTLNSKVYGPYSANASCPDSSKCSIEVLKP